MALKKLDLLTLLISLFILTGCENPSGIGLDIDPDLALSTDTLTLNVETQLLEEDSISTNYTDRSVLAHIKDAKFGTTIANMALAVTLPLPDWSFGTNPELDSAVLVLPYSSTLPLYGDSTVYEAEVRQLSEILYTGTQKAYYNTKKWNTNSTIIGSKSFRPSYKDSVKIAVYGKADSTEKVIPQLRIPLNNTFITNNIVNADPSVLATSKKFADAFKGLYVSLNQSVTSANGGAISFNTSTSGSARLELYYRTTVTEGRIDTLVQSFPIDGSLGTAVTEITWVKSPEVITELTNPVSNKLYLKGFAGTKVKVTFPKSELAKLKDPTKFKNLAINRAELIFSAEQPTQSSLLPLSLLRVYKWDIANQPKAIPDENESDPRYMGPTYIGGRYNSKKENYAINLTGYIQDLVKGQEEYGTFISTYDFLNKNERLSYPGSIITEGGSSTSVKRAKLKVYYTDLK